MTWEEGDRQKESERESVCVKKRENKVECKAKTKKKYQREEIEMPIVQQLH